MRDRIARILGKDISTRYIRKIWKPVSQEYAMELLCIGGI
jgi:hypothetical protein